MLANITYEKVEEVVRLAEQAEATPDQRADDPRRDVPARPGVPPEPQPAPDWREAPRRYLDALSVPAVAEIIGLYRFGHGDAASAQVAVRDSLAHPLPHAEATDWLLSRTDLVSSLKAALEQIPRLPTRG